MRENLHHSDVRAVLGALGYDETEQTAFTATFVSRGGTLPASVIIIVRASPLAAETTVIPRQDFERYLIDVIGVPRDAVYEAIRQL